MSTNSAKKPVLLMILDGWGLREESSYNAVKLAQTPYLDALFTKWPHTKLKCSGTAVGLPPGVMGNSEVGHMNIGAGRVVYQDLMRINQAIESGDFFQNKAFCDLAATVKAHQGTLHLMGLVSDGSVHSHIDHLVALLKMAKQQGFGDVAVHAILDGRDTAPDSGIGFIRQLQAAISEIGIGRIATICGRFWAMDRDTRWDRVEKAFLMQTQSQGEKATDPVNAIEKAYAAGETDEFVKPLVITDDSGVPSGPIEDNDGILFFNFRADRARELTRVYTEAGFDAFFASRPNLCGFVTMTQYEADFDLPVAFEPVRLEGILGETISHAGLNQLRIAETEKYAHVTYFFNGGMEAPFPNEERLLIPSPRDVETYDQKPAMSAAEVTATLLERFQKGMPAFTALNFANMDMVGHTGVLAAAIQACETVDRCVSRVVPKVLDQGGAVLITADHGNCEQMADEDGNPHTAHTQNRVALILVDPERRDQRLDEGILGDIAPTVLEIIGLPKPEQMTGHSLLKRSL